MKFRYPAILLSLFVALPGLAETVVFNNSWSFSRGTHSPEVSLSGYDPSEWEPVTLPHDWAIGGPFDPEEHGFAGKLPWSGEGWYRKSFRVPAGHSGKRIYFDFDGVMASPKVYVNGLLVGEWDYGYNGFRVDATKAIRFGGDNVIAVRANTESWGTRWYPGAGIYRKVSMVVAEPLHLAHWGVFVTTGSVGDPAAGQTATVRIQLENHLEQEQEVTVETRIIDPDGSTVATVATVCPVAPGRPPEIVQSVDLENPLIWDVEHPHLYTARVSVAQAERQLDRQDVRFGFREFHFSAEDGFHLNGRRVQLRGVNLHHDLGPLGDAFNRRAAQRQLEIMKDMGVNAIRTSHNPPAPEVLDLCDEMGLLVWDEVFDKWEKTAGRIGDDPPLKEFSRRQIRQTILRDRNHPSIVVWSVGNELVEKDQGLNPERVAYMARFVRELDDTRPVGMGCHLPGQVSKGIFEALDLTGWNYNRRYAEYHRYYPDRPIVYSESASTLSTRGFYELPLPQRKTDYSSTMQVDSYDLNAASWSDIPDVEFALMEDDDFVAGEFVWTGFDYIGEPTPFDREARSSYFGIVDLCGIPKDRFYLYRSYWRPGETTLHILPHWNWPDRVGQPVPVFVYTNGDSAELFLNGKSQGIRRKGEVPERAENFAAGAACQASSSAEGSSPDLAVDRSRESIWRADRPDPGQWWQADLGTERDIGYLAVTMERPERLYAYEIQVSRDGHNWQTIDTKPVFNRPRWGGPKEFFHTVPTHARYVRVVFSEGWDADVIPAIREFAAYARPVESDYYDLTYRYRLRWNEVPYEPGELRVVAYKDGKVIGEATRRTAGPARKVRLTADRKELSADGEDLSFLLVEAVDANGVACPLADELVRFSIDGPATIAGVGNGNPLSMEPFQAHFRKLFNGKAMLILRSVPGGEGEVVVTASADGLDSGTARISVGP